MVERKPFENNRAYPPRLALERAARGEIRGSSSEGWMDHIESCEKCDVEIERIEDEKRLFEKDPRRLEILKRIRDLEASPQSERPVLRPTVRLVAFAACTALAACLAVVLIPPLLDNDEPVFTAKGGGGLTATVVKGGDSFDHDGAALAAGDTIQLSFLPATSGYLTVWGVERGGKPFLVFPVDCEEAVLVEANGAVPTGSGLMVDHTTRSTVFYAVFSEKPYRVDDMGNKLAKSLRAALDLYPDSVFTLEVRMDETETE